MSFDYSGMANVALKQIADKGRAMVRRTETKSGSSFDPTISADDLDIIAAMTDFNSSEIDGTIIQADDKTVLTITQIMPQHKIVDGGIEYSVVRVKTIGPGDTPIVYKAQVRL